MNGADYYTALEIAELAQRLKVSQMPQTKRRVQEFIKREGWEKPKLHLLFIQFARWRGSHQADRVERRPLGCYPGRMVSGRCQRAFSSA
jgi:hypothetical protein